MIIRNMTAVAATACVGIWMQGCGAAPASPSDDELALQTSGDLDESADAIRGGSNLQAVRAPS